MARDWDFKNLIDISQTLSNDIAVFPGDQRFSIEKTIAFESGAQYLASHITTTLHVGTHADAPTHYDPHSSVSIEQCDLSRYIGEAQVIEVHPEKKRIEPSDLKIAISASIVLFKTDSFTDENVWSSEFKALSNALIEHLFKLGVRTVGIDTPSIDPADDKELESHKTIQKLQMSVIEGLSLTHVKEGHYFLMAAPLKIKEGDAGPLRAVMAPRL